MTNREKSLHERDKAGPFYAGGFLYNPATKKVLLHKRDTRTKINPGKWAFFGGLSKEGETPIETFIREVKEELGILLESTSIYFLCDYFNPDFNTHRYVFFAITQLPKSAMKLREGEDFEWFTLEEALKLDLTKRTRQDLLTFRTKLRKGLIKLENSPYQ